MIDTNNTLQARRFDGQSWIPQSGWTRIIDDVPPVQDLGSIISPGDGFIVVFARRAADNVFLGISTSVDENFWNWAYYQPTKAAPAVVITGHRNLDMLYLGADDRIYHNHI